MTLKIIRNLVKICSTCLNDSLKLAASVFIAGLINGKEEDKKTIKALIVTIKDEGLQDNRLERFEACISAIIDATTLSDDQLDDLIKQKEEEKLLS
jgi:hypothetical protein